MVKKIRRNRVRMTVLLLAALILVLGIETVTAHDHGGYSHDSTIGYTNKDWMSKLPDEITLSSLSIPGTHDTMAYQITHDLNCPIIKHDEMQAQTMNLENQLNSGIRVIDIRLYHIGHVFRLHHGSCFLGTYFDDVLDVVTDFLAENDEETILMRVKQEKTDTTYFAQDFEWYVNQFGDNMVWRGTSDNPTLGEVRGKIVILDNFANGKYGLCWCDEACECGEDCLCNEDCVCKEDDECEVKPFHIQDEFMWSDAWGLEGKWKNVRDHLELASSATSKDDIYINFLSATAGPLANPYFFASGHAEPSTSGMRAPTGFFDPFSFDKYPDFPRTPCFTVGIGELSYEQCVISFEGTNTLTTNYLNGIRHRGEKQRVGIIMADFPGRSLIDNVIAMNPWNWPPVANAGGAYSDNEGTTITFDASASYDPDGDPLTYRWDFNSDGIYDTDPSANSEAIYTWHDDWSGMATVEVSDGNFKSNDMASVMVSNVAPVVTASGETIDENGVATVSGTITDPSYLDTFSVVIDWGEGSPISYNYSEGSTIFSEDHQYLDDNPTGTSSDVFNIGVTVTDDDGGAGSDGTTVIVDNLNPVTRIDLITDETGEEVGNGVRVVLMNTGIDLEGSFTDVGTQDTHTADIDWDDGVIVDLGTTTGSISTTHTYTGPGLYTLSLEVSDDDTGIGPVTAGITVVDSAEAIEVLIGQLEALAADPALDPMAVDAINDALAQLIGEDGGDAANGALDELAKGNLNAALVKMWLAMQSLEAAEASSDSLELTALKSLLALTAKSATITAIVEVESLAVRRNDLRKIADAYDLVAEGDGLLAAQEYVDAVDAYREAAQEVQGIVN